MNEHAPNPWGSDVRLDIARAILASEHATLVPTELADPSGRDSSNVKEVADRMVDEQLLYRVEATRSQPGRGRKAQWAYGVAAQHVDVVERLLAAAEAGAVRQGQQLVFARATEVGELYHLLADPTHTCTAQWFALAEGSPPEYVIAFEGADATDDALRLVAAMEAAGIACRRAHMSRVAPLTRLVTQAQTAVRAAHAVRTRQRTRRAAEGY